MAETREGATRIFTGYLRRTRSGRKCSFTDQAPESVEDPKPRPAKVAITLALAHRIEAAIERGEYRDRADVARQLGISRARVTQILDLTLLAPDLQARLLETGSTEGSEPCTEGELRAIVRNERWDTQRSCWCGPALLPPRGCCRAVRTLPPTTSPLRAETT